MTDMTVHPWIASFGLAIAATAMSFISARFGHEWAFTAGYLYLNSAVWIAIQFSASWLSRRRAA